MPKLKPIECIDNPFFMELYSFASDLSDGNGFPPEANMLAVITASGQASLGRYFAHESGWYEKAILNTVFISESGAKNSFVKDFFREPFEIFEKGKKEEYAISNPALSTRKEIEKHTRAKILSSGTKKLAMAALQGEKSSEDAIQDLVDRLNTYDHSLSLTEPRIFVGTGTAIKIAKELRQQGESLISISSEGGFLDQVCEWKNKDLDLFLTSFTNESWSYESEKSGLVSLKNHSLSILSATHPKIIERFFSNSDFIEKGGMSRLILYNLDAVYFERHAKHQNENFIKAKQKYGRKIIALLSQLYTQDSNRELFEIPVDQYALAALKEFEEKNLNYVTNNELLPIQLASFYRKLHGTALRIAILLNVWMYDKPCIYPVSIDAVFCGIHIANWLCLHTTFVTQRNEMALYMEKIKKAALTMQNLRRNGYQQPFIMARDLQQRCRAIKGSAAEANDCLRALGQYNYCREVGTTEKGSPIFALHPVLV